MLFNSYIFILLFLPCVVAGYYWLNNQSQYTLAQVYLLGMSLWFYGYFNGRYLLIILASILVNYIVYRNMSRTMRYKKLIFACGLVFDIGLLLYYKYMDFFISNINAAFSTDFNLLHIVLPLGISFFTFQQISFIVDAYKGEVPEYRILDYACYVTFFPQLIAGPIVTHDELITQFRQLEKKKINWDNMSRGIYIFVLGLSKKVIIADAFGATVDAYFAQMENWNIAIAICMMFSYTFEIYFDFSGYCDMAIGLGKMLNIDLPVNFNSPYKATSIGEFWDRWHMTLTRFLTRYIYIPLGGNRKGKLRTYVNIVIVFLVSGLWHGANWTFVLWGLLHGLLDVIEKIMGQAFTRIYKGIRWGVTFLLVNLAWVLFRVDSISDVGLFARACTKLQMISVKDGFWNNYCPYEIDQIVAVTGWSILPFLFVIVLFAFAFYFACISKNAYEKMLQFQPNWRNMLACICLLLYCISDLSKISTFLYFNF